MSQKQTQTKHTWKKVVMNEKFLYNSGFQNLKKRWFKTSLNAVAQNFLKNSFPFSELTLETKRVMENGYTISNDS